VALPVFREVMLRVYGDGLVGSAPKFPPPIEQRITQYLTEPPPTLVAGGLVQVVPMNPTMPPQ
jgi:hypothetical protein